MTAGAVYRLVKKRVFPDWLKDQNVVSNLAQLSLRGLSHLAVGAAWGACAGLLLPSLGVTVATGMAIGNITFIGYLIMRLAERILGLNRQPTQEKIFEQLGLPKTAKAVYYYGKKHGQINLKYDAWIREVVLKEIQDKLAAKKGENAYDGPFKQALSETYMNFPKITVEQQKVVVDRLVKCVERIAGILEGNSYKVDKLSYMLLAELSLRAFGAAIKGKLELFTRKIKNMNENIDVLREIPQDKTGISCCYRASMCNYRIDYFKINGIQRATINRIFAIVKELVNADK